MSLPTDIDVKLVVGSFQVARWNGYQIESDMATPADAFSLMAPNPGGYLSGKVHPEDAVRLLVDGELVCTGNLDEVRTDCDERGPIMEMIGRDRGRFLVDCSAPPLSLHGQTLKTLAEKLTGDWITKWEIEGAVKLQPVKRMKVDPGESPLDVLARFVDAAGCIIWLKEDGTGVIGRPNYKQPVDFELYRYLGSSPRRSKNNIVSGGLTDSSKDRFSELTVLASAAGSKTIYAAGASKLKTTARDSGITTHKPKVITGGAVNTAQAQARAGRLVDEGRFEGWQCNYIVKGHRNNDKLWRTNALCRLIDEVSGIDGEVCLVRRRRFVAGDRGKVTEVTLHRAGVWLA